MRPAFVNNPVDRISAQITVIVVAALLTLQVVTTAIFIVTHDRDQRRGVHPEQIVAFAQLLNDLSPERRNELMSSIRNRFRGLDARVDNEAGSQRFSASAAADPHLRNMNRDGGEALEIGRLIAAGSPASAAAADPSRMAVRLSDGTIFSAISGRPPPMWMSQHIQFVVFAGLVGISLMVWTSAMLSRPLRAFEEAARSLGRDGEGQPVAERGPREIRTAAAALNRMRERVKSLIGERTRMLAALSHDLRTPLTRIRLRTEFIADETLRGQLLRDIAQMNGMVEQVLIYLRDSRGQQTAVPVDVASIAEDICHEFADLGHPVTYEGPNHAAVAGHFDGLQRALTNLIDNAVRHGGSARVEVRLTGAAVVIEVRDRGPGLSADLREAMFEPFVRGDAARGQDGAGGFGLGLPIARAVILAHGGSLELAESPGGGLMARISLPMLCGRGQRTESDQPD